MCEDIARRKLSFLQFFFSSTKTNSSFIRQWRSQKSVLPLPDSQFTLSLLFRYEMSCQHLFPPTLNLLCFTGILFLNKPHHILVFLSLDQIKQAEGVSNEPLQSGWNIFEPNGLCGILYNSVINVLALTETVFKCVLKISGFFEYDFKFQTAPSES